MSGLPRLLFAHPVLPGMAQRHVEWSAEVRRRRDELGRSRQRVGIRRQVVWFHPSSLIAVTRVDADDPVQAVGRLRASDDEFDQWYAAKEDEIHGGPLLGSSLAAPEPLTEYLDEEPNDLDMLIALAAPLLPGRTDDLVAAVGHSTNSGDGLARVRRWGLKRLTVWLHRTTAADIVIYESIGNVPEMVRSLSEDDDDLIAGQQRAFNALFGIDVVRSPWPIPMPALSWTATDAPPL